MKPPTRLERISPGIVWAILAMCVVGWPTHTHAQPRVPVQDVEGLSILTKLVVTLQMVLAPGSRADVNPLYAYDPRELAGAEVHPDRIGGVATVSQCEAGGAETEGEAWCARYFTDINQAFRAAYRANRGTDGANNASPDVYFATTYPLPNVEPERRFVSGLSP